MTRSRGPPQDFDRFLLALLDAKKHLAPLSMRLDTFQRCFWDYVDAVFFGSCCFLKGWGEREKVPPSRLINPMPFNPALPRPARVGFIRFLEGDWGLAFILFF